MDKKRVVISTAAAGIVSAAFHAGVLPWAVGYSDVVHLFPVALAPGVPYIERAVEYPVLTGLFMRLCGWLGRDVTGYYVLTATALGFAAALCAGLLADLAPEKKVMRRWSFAPSLLLLLVFNWDVLAVLCVVAALWFMRRRQASLAGLALALGFCFKLYPAIYLAPAVVAWRKDGKSCAKLILAFAVAAAAINLPFALINFWDWSYCFTFNFSPHRLPNPDSIYSVLRFALGWPGGAGAGRLSSVLLAGGLCFSMWRLKDAAIERLCSAATLVLLLSAKFFSPQYALWLLPFMVVEDFPGLPSYGFELANLGVLFSILNYILASNAKWVYELCAFFVVARHACLVLMLRSALGRSLSRA